ncbi:MAG TPA: phosphoribosylformylglycinamidine cyclo-ligase, partial [Alphaproteobacteria bacterium]|nr:phosphoribosylformylglycinamidine cyclo-ligase [Alphaproteobacteria bacterium]
VKALAHITGGGLTENLPRILPSGLAAEIDLAAWDLPPIFSWLKQLGQIADAELLKTFNCGIGMIAVTAPDRVEETLNSFESAGEQAHVIGRLTDTKSAPQVIYRGALQDN